MADISPVFTSLPIEKLIAAPLKAASDSNLGLAAATLEYVKKVGFNDQGGPNQLNFTVPGQSGTVSAPLLTLLPIPSLLVESVDVDLDVEVTGVDETNTDVDVEIGLNVNYDSWWGDVKFYGKLAASYSSQSSLKQTGRYGVRVSARQQPMTEGMSSIITILTQAMSQAVSGGSTPVATGAPTITQISPTSVAAGAQVTITGTNLANVTSLTAGSVTLTGSQLSLTSTTVQFAAATGMNGSAVTVTNPSGSKTSTETLTVS